MDYYRSTATRMFMGSTAGEPDGIPIIDPSTPEGRDMLFPRGMGFGHDPSQYVPDMMAAPLGMKTYSPNDWDALYDEQEAKQNSLEHIYLRGNWPNLNQNGHGYCWGYSVAQALMLKRMAMNLPFVRLNPHSVCSIIKGGRDEGGWCGLSLNFIREHGCAEEGTGPGQWPLHSRQHTRFNDPAVKASMLKYQVTDDWFDIGKPLYSQQLKDEQAATCLFDNNPCALDWNEWGHSVTGARWCRVERGLWLPLILNSWPNWGRRGLALIQRGWKHDGAVSVVNTMGA